MKSLRESYINISPRLKMMCPVKAQAKGEMEYIYANLTGFVFYIMDKKFQLLLLDEATTSLLHTVAA
jgi:hypothetical protein